MFGKDSMDYSRFEIEFLNCGFNKTAYCPHNKSETQAFLGPMTFKLIHHSSRFQAEKFGDQAILRETKMTIFQINPN
jgi:hypothetical protein